MRTSHGAIGDRHGMKRNQRSLLLLLRVHANDKTANRDSQTSALNANRRIARACQSKATITLAFLLRKIARSSARRLHTPRRAMRAHATVFLRHRDDQAIYADIYLMMAQAGGNDRSPRRNRRISYRRRDTRGAAGEPAAPRNAAASIAGPQPRLLAIPPPRAQLAPGAR
jgi:hypothetical protein